MHDDNKIWYPEELYLFDACNLHICILHAVKASLSFHYVLTYG